jgi:cell division protein FtsQ
VQDRPGRWRLLLRRQRRLLRPLAWGALAVSVVLLVTMLVHAGASDGTLATMREQLGGAASQAGLRVTDIRIEGRNNTPEPLLRAALGVSRGDAMLGFSVAAARARIESLSWVEHATVERRLPGTVVVQLTERRPFAVWQNQGKFALIDREGQPVVDQDIARFRDLPLVVGAGATVGATALLDALRDRPAIASHVTAAVRVGERRWNLRLANGADVLLPEGEEVAALDRLLQLQQDHAVLDRPLQAIDLRLPDRLVLRAAQDAHPDSPHPDTARPDAAHAPPAPKKPT